jgi:tellurite resistance protein
VFLHRLIDQDARRTFARLAHRVLQSSGETSPREARVLYVMLSELELDVEALEGDEPLERVVLRIHHPRARVAALLELLRLAYADGDMRPEERAFIHWVATCWKMNDGLVREIEAWAKKHDALVQEAIGLIDSAH